MSTIQSIQLLTRDPISRPKINKLYSKNKENVPKTKSRFYKDREAEAKKRNKKSKKRSKKYALDASINTNLGRNLTYTVTGASKDTGKRNRPRSARPTSAKRRI